jgi:hypothetical protein
MTQKSPIALALLRIGFLKGYARANRIEYSVHPWGTGAAANTIGTGFRFLIQSGRCRLKQFAGFV